MSERTQSQIYWSAWLSAHPDRSADWLRRMIDDGFHVHHLDANPLNNDPGNLVLIDGADHKRLHTTNTKMERHDKNELIREGIRKAKERGVRIGAKSWNGAVDVAAMGRAARVKQADDRAASIGPLIETIRANGHQKYQEVADQLNDLGIPTARDGVWAVGRVIKVINRYNRLALTKT